MELEREKTIVAESMVIHGGSFEAALGSAIMVADNINAQRIKSMWPELWDEYLFLENPLVNRQD